MYDNFTSCGVDPRNIAQRIMEVGCDVKRDSLTHVVKAVLLEL